MKTGDFSYELPHELIAQVPVEPRDKSRLMVINRNSERIEHRHFFELPAYLKAGDVLVFNDSRVIPARLFGQKEGSGGRVEILLLRRLTHGQWEALVKPGKRVKAGTRVEINNATNTGGHAPLQILATVIEERANGIRVIAFSDEAYLPELGKIPLPPYIHTPLSCPERYQTVYAKATGSVAAPTAGLHLTRQMLNALRQKGVKCLFVTLHIGLDTFRPVTEDDPREHKIHREYGIVSSEVAEEITRARTEGRRIICVGTTSMRVLEQAAQNSTNAHIAPFQGWAELFILPGYHFRVVDGLVTNFHLPESTLLMMVSAFAGKDLIFRAYQEAIKERYRFYSFGDAMLIL
ncbi:MAG: tRNA preQ1(34) S-adenosylmethionine ribosyltransferase-isomerase QueA [Chloroflexota bacterium]